MAKSKPSLLLMIVGQKGYDFACDIISALDERADIKAIISYEQPDMGKGFSDIRQVAENNDIPFFATRRPNPELLGSVDLVLLVGWQFMISNPTKKIVAIHDSLLPRYRGFSPTVMMHFINGEPKIGVSAFFPSNQVDAGDIIAQESVDISHPIRIHEAMQLLRRLLCERLP